MQLSQAAKDILSRQLNGLPVDAKESHGSIFRYATRRDKLILVVSAACAVIAGALNPLLTVVYGNLIDAFNGFAAGSIEGSELRSTVAEFTLSYVYCAIAIFVFIYVSTVGFYYTGERIAQALHRAYLKALVSQNMSFFDGLGTGEITSRIMSDMGVIQETITSKISIATTALANFASAFIIMYVVSWRTALVLSPTFVIMLVVMTFGGKYSIKHHKEAMVSQSQASSLAEETISSVRHISAFGIQNFLVAKYHSYLQTAGRSDMKARDTVSGLIAWSNAMPCLVYTLSFWAGSIFLVKGETSVAAIATTTLAIVISAFAIIRVAPSLQALTSSIASASKVLATIARRSPQDPFSSQGEHLQSSIGDITLRGVSLVYPSRDDVLVLDNVDIVCPSQKTTAIVGASGCGKSSIVGLVQRFYEPTSGRIELDGHDVQGLNLRWLRNQISLVDQEPVLFNTTIFENICYGLVNSTTQRTVTETRELVISAAKDANAHDFISTLANGYETLVGERGLQLSGGQRQRIAIARALIKHPSVLLLDEATSALDSKSEGVVQSALDSAIKDRTTIVIAHRLSTIRNADQIVVMSHGRVVERGIHAELIQKNGVYAGLVQKQSMGSDENHPSSLTATKLDAEITSKDMSLSDHPIEEKQEHNLANAAVKKAVGKEEPTERGLGFVDTLRFIVHINHSERGWLAIGTICAIIAGLGIPIQSILFAKLLDALALPAHQLRHEINFWSGLYVLMAGVAFIFWMGLGVAFARSTEALSRRAKEWCLRSIVSQDAAFFDEKNHSSGALSGLLSTSTENLSNLSGPVIGSILTFLSTIITGIIISLVIGWKLALVCTATIPFVVACGWVRLQMLAIFDGKVRQSGKDAAAYASEIISSLRTVASLGLEEHAVARYDEILSEQASKSLHSMLSASALYAGSQSLVFLCAALAFWYGGRLVSTREYTGFQFYICFVALISGAQTAGSIFSYAPDASKAMHASQELKDLFETKSKMNDEHGSRPPANANNLIPEKNASFDGLIEMRSVNFHYPSRPNQQILSDFSLTIHPGQFIALVGPSGCGKTSILSLLERFYDPDSGTVAIDGRPLTSFDAREHRKNLSLVSQEATLYSGTIRENIAMGVAGTNIDVSDADIEAVCKQANIHPFITSLPDGLSTVVGTRGTMLSGGQRQRITIARAVFGMDWIRD